MTTLCLRSDAPIAASSFDNTAAAVQTLPHYEPVDLQERRWQLEWERRNIED